MSIPFRDTYFPWLISSILVAVVFIIIGLVSAHYATVFIKWQGLAEVVKHGDIAFKCTPLGIQESNIKSLDISGLFGDASIGVYMSDVNTNNSSHPISKKTEFTFCGFSQVHDARRYLSAQPKPTGGVIMIEQFMFFQPCYAAGTYWNFKLMLACVSITIISFLLAIIVPVTLRCIGIRRCRAYIAPHCQLQFQRAV